MSTLAVYVTPPLGDSFYEIGSAVLGYDIWTQKQVPNGKFAGSVGGASTFGFHCTVGDALTFGDQDEEKIHLLLKGICKKSVPFKLSKFFLSHDFWAGPQVLVAEFLDPGGQLSKVAELVTTTINPLYVESPYYPKLLSRLPNYNEDYYRRFGAPQVLERYTPHFTFASGIPDKNARDDLIVFLSEQSVFQPGCYEYVVDRLHLVRQKDDGFYEVVGSYLFETGEAV